MAPTKQQGPKEKFLKKIQSFSDTLYYVKKTLIWVRDVPATLPKSVNNLHAIFTMQKKRVTGNGIPIRSKTFL
jgi:hypothetical protein